MDIKRHVLLEVSNLGRELAFEWMMDQTCCKGRLAEIKELVVTGLNGTKIPAIVRRKAETARKDVIAVGFSSPLLNEGNRLRIPGFVPIKEIQNAVHPYEILAKEFSERTNALKALAKIYQNAQEYDITLGVFGSAALEVYTSLPYTHNDSDLDLIIRGAEIEKIENFYRSILEIGKQYDCKVDLELECQDYEIKVAELFTDTEHILGKGMDGVELITREKVNQWLHS